ncbi:MAG: hypothetical protein Q4B14_00765 [Clostridia bacterium]|nr:hypothetical protein [Clostridia bacterium]
MQEQLNRLKAGLRPTGLYKLDDKSLVHAELCAYAKGLEILDRELSNLEQEAFVATAEDYGLSIREELSDRKLSEETIENRRRMLNYRSSVTANDFNMEGIKKALLACGLETEIFESPGEFTIFISCISMLDKSLTQEKAIELAKSFTPAHLNVVFDFRNFSWDKIESLDLCFDDMDNKDLMWDEIDTISLEED